MQKALYLLSDLNDADISWFAQAGARRDLASGTFAIEEGKPIEAMMFVIDGQLEVLVGEGQRLAEIGAGEILGEMSLIDNRAPAASVRALTDVKLLAVPQAAIKARLEQDVEFAARFHRAIAVFLSDRLRGTVVRLGYGEATPQSNRETFEMENELDDGLLDNLHLAGDRMRRLIGMLEGRRV